MERKCGAESETNTNLQNDLAFSINAYENNATELNNKNYESDRSDSDPSDSDSDCDLFSFNDKLKNSALNELLGILREQNLNDPRLPNIKENSNRCHCKCYG